MLLKYWFYNRGIDNNSRFIYIEMLQYTFTVCHTRTETVK